MKYPNEVKIAISLSTDIVMDGGNRVEKNGLTSQYISKINQNNSEFSSKKITNKIFIKDSLFRQPAD
jgi:hypothetical protein